LEIPLRLRVIARELTEEMDKKIWGILVISKLPLDTTLCNFVFTNLIQQVVPVGFGTNNSEHLTSNSYGLFLLNLFLLHFCSPLFIVQF
jgi:hypothetical protein